MKKHFSALVLFLLLVSAQAVTFRDFSGACQGGDLSSPYWDNLIGWNRFDISWSAAEPEEGKYDEAYLKKLYDRIQKNAERGVKVLPVIGYAPGWASTRNEYTCENGRRRKVYMPLEGNEYLLKEFDKAKDGSWTPRKNKDGSTERKVKNPRIPLAPESVAKWQAFIRRVTSDLRKAPYNIEYFQIWNEAHPGSGFYDGTLDDYMKNIHLPAARVVRETGGKVVYGGFPCCGTVDQLAKLLTRHKAWGTVDVIDIHYFPEWCMDYMRRKAAEAGYPEMGIWQTEIIFHRKYYAVGQIYPTVLYWGLKNNWSDPDRYKLMIFAFGSPDDPKAYGYGKCMTAGKTLTPHGKALETLAGIFGNGEIEAYSDVKSEPELEFRLRDSRMTAFRSGKKILIAAVFTGRDLEDHEEKALKTLTLTLPGIAPETVKSVSRIGVFGEQLDLAGSWKKAGRGIEVEAPLEEETDNRYRDKFLKEDSLRRPVFYVLIELQ